jgi:ubiquinone/menaquinone biosynthesis C-methylase UbiE
LGQLIEIAAPRYLVIQEGVIMFRTLEVWWLVLTQIGNAMRLSRQVDGIFRYFILETLRNEQFFDYLKEPRTYPQVLAEFGYVDSGYTTYLFDVLTSDKPNILYKENGRYQFNADAPLPQLDQVITKTNKQVHNFILMAQGMAGYLVPRLRDEPVEFTDSFEADGRQLLSKFDQTIGSDIYSNLRRASFAYLGDAALGRLRGGRVLEVGCGSGHSTAELWLKLGGEARIDGIDPVKGMLELAEQYFGSLLNELDPSHPPLTDANRPRFQEAGATDLPFEDNSFDAVWSPFVLHWTPDPEKAVRETLRVLKPGGLIFGLQPIKPLANPYFDLIVRANGESYGFFWAEDLRRWYANHGVNIHHTTPITIFKGVKPSMP